jgi:putative hemolysin
LVILGLILLNGLFSGSEIAVISLRRTRLAELVDRGRGGAEAITRLRATPERFLATVQVGITVVGATAAAFGGASLAVRVAPLIAEVPVLAPWSQGLALLLVVGVVSTLSLVLGELVPKSLALRNAEAYALLVARPFELLAWVASPAIWALVGISNVFLRLFGDHTSFTETRLSRDELMQLVDEAATAGSVDPGASEIATRALDLDALDAEDIMVHRLAIVSVPADVDADVLFGLAKDGTHARLPVHEGDLDQTLGVVRMQEALVAAREGGKVDLRPLVVPMPFVPEWIKGTDLLRLLQNDPNGIAMVVDEHGMVRGMVGIEDLFEELVGDVLSEREGQRPLWTAEGDGAWLVDGRTPVHELERGLEIELPQGESFATVAGLCLFLAGKIPQVGETLDAGADIHLEIVDASPRRVRQVRLRINRQVAPQT